MTIVKNIKKKPSIQALQNFTKLYFKKNTPKVKWKKMRNTCRGMADTKKRIIYINPIFDKKCFGCCVDGASCLPKTRMKLYLYEGFFATLLHEIGHFKIKRKIPRYMVKIKKKLKKEYPKDIDMQVYSACDYLKKKRNETADEYTSRLWELESAISGGNMKEHEAVEEWSVKEFKKQRKFINALSKKKKS